MSFGSTTPAYQGTTRREQAELVSTKYTGVGDGEASRGVRAVLGSYQCVFRVDGLIGILLIGLTLAGVVVGRGTIRAGAALFLITGMTLLVLPHLSPLTMHAMGCRRWTYLPPALPSA